MGNGTLDPRSLTSEERAWCDAIAVALCSSGNYSAAGAISEAVTLGLPERRALFGEPASEGGKVECPNCRKPASHADEHKVWPGTRTSGGAGVFTCQPAQSEPAKMECPNCKQVTSETHRLGHPHYGWACEKPAQPEPIAAAMPEAMRNAANSLRACAVKARYPAILTERADALESSFWRTHAAQPANDLRYRKSIAEKLGMKMDDYDGVPALCDIETFVHAEQPARAVAMTEELERVLDAAEAHSGWHMDQGRPESFDEIDAAIASVRSQAAEAGKVRLPKVRIALDTMRAHFEPNCQGQCRFPMVWEFCIAALAELDAAEGRK